GCGTDGEGGRDDLTGPQRSGAGGGSLGQALREDFGEAVGLAGAGRGGDDVDAHEWSPAMPKMMLKGLKVCGLTTRSRPSSSAASLRALIALLRSVFSSPGLMP